jgi:GTPase
LSVFNRSDADEFTRGTKTLLVYPELPGRNALSAELRLDEAKGLALAIGLNVQSGLHFKIRTPRAATLFGGGQIEQICSAIESAGIELLIVDTSLTAIQQSNLEKRTGVKTIDRTGLILEIFGERAATAEGRLQVELAHLDYQAGRLVRSWTHLERQRGGFGFLGGPGETQIEADRRMIRDRMSRLRRELEDVKRTRGLHRARRQRAPWPVIALVGYTNAGKSTLFNRLTRADVLAEDMLFATLDPTMREVALPGVEKAILSDTVGFVSDLPTQLVAAFRATLEEVMSADIIVHVRDISHPATDAQRNDVLTILRDLDLFEVDENEHIAPIIEVWNKADLLSPDDYDACIAKANAQGSTAVISAISGSGIDNFVADLSAIISAKNITKEIYLSTNQGAALAWLHDKGEVTEILEKDAEFLQVKASLNQQSWGRFFKLFAV